METKIKIAGIRVCSKAKNPTISSGDKCFLSDLYINTNIKGFFRKLKALGIPYFVLSRKFGICTEGKHNIAYSSTEHLTDEELTELLKTHNKWVEMLREAGFRVSTVQRLEEYDKISKSKNQNQTTLSSIFKSLPRKEIYSKN